MKVNKYSVFKTTGKIKGKINPRRPAFSAARAPNNRLWFPVLLVLFALLLATGTMRAHGGQGYYQIRGEQMGDYTVHVWTSPGLLRTGDVHVDTAIFDAAGMPAFQPVVMVRFSAAGGDPPPQTAMAGSPYDYYPYTREARLQLDTPGAYRMEVMLSDEDGMVGMSAVDVRVQTITDSAKLVIIVLGLLSLACVVWLLLHARSFWASPGQDSGDKDKAKYQSKAPHRHTVMRGQGATERPGSIHAQGLTGPNLRVPPLPDSPGSGFDSLHTPLPEQRAGQISEKSVLDLHPGKPETGGQLMMTANATPAAAGERSSDATQSAARKTTATAPKGWYAWLNGPYHARALWLFMLIVMAHWLEHVLQIYQIYGLGWAASAAGGLIGLLYPVLITSELLHFVYDFIQWIGIVLLRGGFTGPARKYWWVAMVAQTWHFIEHVLLMGQYLTGYYIAGRIKQTSLLELYFPREELHFVYNLIVFIPMVIAVHYYLRPRVKIDPSAAAKS